jgi:NTP pyrophosphatase (non-canonical NTP hydrolase)
VADVGIGLLLLCERIGLDFVEVMRAKVKKNAERYPVEGARGRAERP